jgi:hypothetical protein
MMTELIKIVTEATEAERREAYAAFGDLHSHNEGYGVLAEEIDEVQAEIRFMMHYFDRLLRVIRCDLRELGSDLGQIRRNAQLAACECIQVAAVAQRFLDLLEKEKRNESVHDCDSR